MTSSVRPARLLNDPIGMSHQANRLLAALPPDELQAWLPSLRPMLVQRGQVLPRHQAVFPTTATVSLYASTRDGHAAELATVGSEGMVGLELLSGVEPAGTQAEVTGTGYVFALAGGNLRAEFRRSGSAMELLLRYVQWHMTQLMQRAVCAHHHAIEQRLCRCLLDSLDRNRRSTTIELTHQSLALRLGVRRESITACAQRLQGLGAITYQRGSITVLDTGLLRGLTCACYATARSAYERWLPTPEPVPAFVASVANGLNPNGLNPNGLHTVRAAMATAPPAWQRESAA